MRATAVALSILVIHVLGDVPSPSLVGLISDARSLSQAVLIIPIAVLLGGLIWTYAAWRESRVSTAAVAWEPRCVRSCRLWCGSSFAPSKSQGWVGGPS